MSHLKRRKLGLETMNKDLNKPDLGPSERIDDLCRNDLKLIQNKDVFCFGMDAVLLSTFAKVKKGRKVLDLCTGNGVIPILMQDKNPGTEYVGLEIQEVSADLAKRNVLLNGLEDRISIIKGDLREASSLFGEASFNVVTVNPPYMNENHGLVNPESQKAIARHEIMCTLDDVVCQASACLKLKGSFFMVHRPKRLVEIIATMLKYHIEPKRMRLVYPHFGDEANMVLIEGIKGGHSQITVEKPLIVYNDDASFTEELLAMYGMEGQGNEI